MTFFKSPKPCFRAIFELFFGIFPKIWVSQKTCALSLFSHYRPPAQYLKKDEWIPRKQFYRYADEQTDHEQAPKTHKNEQLQSFPLQSTI